MCCVPRSSGEQSLMLLKCLWQQTHHVIPFVTQEAPSRNPLGQTICCSGQICFSGAKETQYRNRFSLQTKTEIRLFVRCGDPIPLLVTPCCCCVLSRLSMAPDEQKDFWRQVQFTVDKDVVRTDRSNQFFRGEGNPNVETMR